MDSKALTFRDVRSIPKVKFDQQIVLLLDQLTIAENIAGISRLADAFQVDTLILFNCSFKNPNKINKISRSTFNKHEIILSKNLDELKNKFEDYTWLGLEWTNNSIPVAKYQGDHKLLLVLGNEKNGISLELLERIDTCVHIDMFGLNSSMNVASATGIALYQIRQTEINK